MSLLNSFEVSYCFHHARIDKNLLVAIVKTINDVQPGASLVVLFEFSLKLLVLVGLRMDLSGVSPAMQMVLGEATPTPLLLVVIHFDSIK